MDKRKLYTNQANIKHKKLKGLQDAGNITFECAECGMSLLVLQLVTTTVTVKTDVLTRIAVRCEKCGGYSYVKQVAGQFYAGTPNDDMCFDILDSDEIAPETDILFKAWSK